MEEWSVDERKLAHIASRPAEPLHGNKKNSPGKEMASAFSPGTTSTNGSINGSNSGSNSTPSLRGDRDYNPSWNVVEG